VSRIFSPFVICCVCNFIEREWRLLLKIHLSHSDVWFLCCMNWLDLNYSLGRDGLKRALLFYTGQTALRLSSAEAANWAQCAAPVQPVGLQTSREYSGVPVLSLQVPEKEPWNANCVDWLWHSIYQENADLFPPLPCIEDTVDR